MSNTSGALPATLVAAAALLEPLLPAQRWPALREAVARVAQGHARVLVLGEAERGKSTLVGTETPSYRGHRQLAEVVWRYGHGWIGRVGLPWPGSGRCGRAGDLVPGGESAGHFASVFLGAESVAARSEVRGYPAERGQEPLGVPG
jgi:hypothetical protein